MKSKKKTNTPNKQNIGGRIYERAPDPDPYDFNGKVFGAEDGVFIQKICFFLGQGDEKNIVQNSLSQKTLLSLKKLLFRG